MIHIANLVKKYGELAAVNDISDFLRRTYQIVSAGEESEHVNAEAELTHLLRHAALSRAGSSPLRTHAAPG